MPTVAVTWDQKLVGPHCACSLVQGCHSLQAAPRLVWRPAVLEEPLTAWISVSSGGIQSPSDLPRPFPTWEWFPQVPSDSAERITPPLSTPLGVSSHFSDD